MLEAAVATVLDAVVEVPLWTSLFTHRYTYLLFAILLVIGLYMVVVSSNLVKKIIGLNLFQTSVFLFFVSTAYVRDEDGEAGRAPVVPEGGATAYDPFASPLPHVIVLTAIVVGVALTAVGLALVVRIYSEYGTLDEETLREVRADD